MPSNPASLQHMRELNEINLQQQMLLDKAESIARMKSMPEAKANDF